MNYVTNNQKPLSVCVTRDPTASHSSSKVEHVVDLLDPQVLCKIISKNHFITIIKPFLKSCVLNNFI